MNQSYLKSILLSLDKDPKEHHGSVDAKHLLHLAACEGHQGLAMPSFVGAAILETGERILRKHLSIHSGSMLFHPMTFECTDT
jgi:hypothetical protein